VGPAGPFFCAATAATLVAGLLQACCSEIDCSARVFSDCNTATVFYIGNFIIIIMYFCYTSRGVLLDGWVLFFPENGPFLLQSLKTLALQGICLQHDCNTLLQPPCPKS
jgi:hypothetical protein